MGCQEGDPHILNTFKKKNVVYSRKRLECVKRERTCRRVSGRTAFRKRLVGLMKRSSSEHSSPPTTRKLAEVEKGDR